VDEISNEKVLAKVQEDKQIVKIIQQRQTSLDWTYFEASELTAGYCRRTNEGKT